MNREFAERLKLLKDFWGNSSGGAYFLPEEKYAHRKEHKKTQETGMPDILLQDAANLVNTQFRAYPFYKASEWMPHKKLLLNSIVF